MPIRTVAVTKTVRFVPEEAPGIEAALRAIAQRGRELAARLRHTNGELEANWEGQASVRFLGDSSNMPSVGGSLSDWLEGEAGRIGSIVVERQVTVYEEQWVPE